MSEAQIITTDQSYLYGIDQHHIRTYINGIVINREQSVCITYRQLNGIKSASIEVRAVLNTGTDPVYEILKQWKEIGKVCSLYIADEYTFTKLHECNVLIDYFSPAFKCDDVYGIVMRATGEVKNNTDTGGGSHL